MDLKALVDIELVEPLKAAIIDDDLIATRRLIESVRGESNITVNKDEVKVYAMSYILELRDGEQYKSPPTLSDIEEWVNAKGLDGLLDPETVLSSILRDGTIWDRQGGVQGLKNILNPENIQRIMNTAIGETITELKSTQWQLR